MEATHAAKNAARSAADRADRRRHRREERNDRNKGRNDTFATLIGESETCTACETDFDVRDLLRGEDGAICMDCDLQQLEDVRSAGSRRDLTSLVGMALLLLISAGCLQRLEHANDGRDPYFFMMAAGLFGLISILAMVTTARELRFDLPYRDPVVLAKHAIALVLGLITVAVNTWVFYTAFML